MTKPFLSTLHAQGLSELTASWHVGTSVTTKHFHSFPMRTWRFSRRPALTDPHATALTAVFRTKCIAHGSPPQLFPGRDEEAVKDLCLPSEATGTMHLCLQPAFLQHETSSEGPVCHSITTASSLRLGTTHPQCP
ncbi:hypothetical protein TREES_T100007653 [Tupaia chinensis]|uniref:Uncharacterized protein n=1 Tax=Tupaia chinensis TaxID=246437 RepID=L9KRR2_TUPCH|nr:hypothetical protein TREES_T100007653 [Tupaia chinensis]